MTSAAWQIDNDFQISTILHGMRLVVRKFDRCARFVVLRRDGRTAPDLMLASGTTDSVDSAMAAARNTAQRLRATLARGRLGRPSA